MSHSFDPSRTFPRSGLRPQIDQLFRRWCAASLIFLAVAACAPTVPERSAPVDLPAQFSDSGTVMLPGRWWQSFNDPVLDDLMTQTLAGNLSLKSAWDRLDQARAIARTAGAQAYPTLNAEGQVARNWLLGDDQSSSSYGFGLVAGYEVDLWGRIRSQREAALLDAVASEEDLKAAALTVAAQLATTWYQLVEQYSQAEILNRQIVTNSQSLELISLRFRTGQSAIADVLQQRQLIETNRGELARIQSRTQVLEHQLAVLAGQPPDRSVVPTTGAFVNLSPLPETGVPAELVRRRPDIRAAWARLAAADYRQAAAVADRFPRLSLSGQVGAEAGRVGDLFDNWLTSLAGHLVGPLLDGGLRRAEIDRNRALVAEELHGYGQTVLGALGEVEDALVQERLQRQYIAHLDRQQGLAEQAVERIRDRYLNGAEDYQRVLSALLSLQGLQRNRLTARRELYEYRIQLCRALAGVWELEPPGSEMSDR